jgi:Predicted permease, DMT superfamily
MSSSSESHAPSSTKAYIYVALTTLLFSSMEISLKSISGHFHPLQLNVLRFAIGGVFLLPFALRAMRKRGATLDRSDIGYFALSGFACVVASMSLYQFSIEHAKAGIVAILFSCNPVFVIPLAAIFLKERIRGFTIASMLASLAGMAAIVNPAGGGTGEGTSGLGIGLSLGSALIFAAYGVMGKGRSRRLGGFANTSFSFIAGSAELLVLILISRIPSIASALKAGGLGLFADIPLFTGFEPRILPLFAYICLGVTGLGYAFYFLAIEASSAQTASLVFYIKPALAPLLALAILGESIAPSTIVGIVLIAAGSCISVLGARAQKA